VFGVCVAGVSCLYLLPGLARSPHQVGDPRPLGGPTPDPSVTSAATDPTSTSASSRARTAPEPARSTRPPRVRVQPTAARSTMARRPSAPAATPFDPARSDDALAPAPVAVVTSSAVTPDRLTVRWPAARDNVGVVRYRVLLNGYEVASTPVTHATVRWFNDDASQHVIQVRALDAAGNEGTASPALLVARPTPSPTPSSASPSPSPTAAVEPSSSPTASPSPTPSPSPNEPGAASIASSTPDHGEEPPVTPSPQPTPSVGAR
jgi:hypothetical protein